jgi:hypothetical protein
LPRTAPALAAATRFDRGLYHLDRFLGTGFLAITALLALLEVDPGEVPGLTGLFLRLGLDLEGSFLAVPGGAAIDVSVALCTVHPRNLQ